MTSRRGPRPPSVTTFVIVHGSGDGGWAWHLVQRALRGRGHETVAPDLPTDTDDATWDDCVQVLVDAVDATAARSSGGPDVVLVAHSAGSQVTPLAVGPLGARLQVHVAGMVPRPGESAYQWFDAAGWAESVAAAARADGGLTGSDDPLVAFYHDVPAELAHEAMARERPTADRLARAPWPLPALPDVPARYVVTTRDRFMPPAVQRRVAQERLGVTDPEELASGHCPHLSRPEELAGVLERLAGQPMPA